MKLILFDDVRAGAWSPFALTRPCGELLFGTCLIRERLERLVGVSASAAISRPWLAHFTEPGTPIVTAQAEGLGDGEARLFLSTRAIPTPGVTLELDEAEPRDLRVADEIVGRLVPAGSPAPDAEWIAKPTAAPDHEAVAIAGRVIENVWELVSGNRDQLILDLTREIDRDWQRPAASAAIVGGSPVLLAPDVRIEPGVVFDTREGPVLLDRGVEARSGARLAGPMYVGPGSRLLGGAYATMSAGPVCSLRGEIAETIVLGYSNKAHDGFLGHAYLGRWVNLGALTTNSNLKNNYGPVRLGTADGTVDTGLTRFGCLLGDHVKSAIGTLLDTGTEVGAGANLFGPRMPPKYVRPFSWGGGPDTPLCRLEAFLSTARTVFGRRGVAFDGTTERWLADTWTAAAEPSAAE